MRSFQSLFLVTVTAKAHSVLSAKQLPLEQSENANRRFLEVVHLTLTQEENQQLTFLKSNLIQIQYIPVAKKKKKASFTVGRRRNEMT